MAKLSLEDIEFIKILATSDATILELGMNDSTRKRLDDQLGVILRQYYQENTTDSEKIWTIEFEKNGINEDQGKAAIACARRLGLDIS